MAQSSQAKGKETMSVELSAEAPPKTKKNSANNQEFKFPPKQYSFKDEQEVTIFHLFQKGNKLKLTEVRRPNEAGRTNDPNYCLFHRMIHHLTHKCFVLKDKIQVLVDAGVLTLKSEQKTVTTNMVTLEFDTLPKVTNPDGHPLVPKARLEISNPSAKQQEAKGLLPLTLKTREIMWVHLNLAKEKQWDSKKSKPKGKSCNAVSVLPDDDNVIISLSDSENEKHAFTAQDAAPQPTGTRSGKSYLNSTRKLLTRHNSQRRQQKYMFWLQSRRQKKKSRKKSSLTAS